MTKQEKSRVREGNSFPGKGDIFPHRSLSRIIPGGKQSSPERGRIVIG